MRKSRLPLRIAVVCLFSAVVPFLATAAEPRPEARVDRGGGSCESACHDDHRTWVELCIEFHDPHEIVASARGQCIAEGAERLGSCLESCP